LRRFFRQTFCFAFFPLGGGGSLTSRRIASSNLIGWFGLRNLADGIMLNIGCFLKSAIHKPVNMGDEYFSPPM